MTEKDWINLNKKYQPINPAALEKVLTSSPSKNIDIESEILKDLTDDQKAHHLFILSNRYFDTNPRHCINLLQQVLKLDPNHFEAKKDLNVLKERINF